MKFQPLQSRVLVKRIVEQDKTKGGIIIPDAAKEKPAEGTVVAVGNGRRLENGSIARPDVSRGDTVVFGKYAGTEVLVGGVEHLVLHEDDILGRRTES